VRDEGGVDEGAGEHAVRRGVAGRSGHVEAGIAGQGELDRGVELGASAANPGDKMPIRATNFSRPLFRAREDLSLPHLDAVRSSTIRSWPRVARRRSVE